jgi:hypothetical protein
VSGLILHLSILQSHVFLLNSRLGLFTAALLPERLFSRSYETILPSSLAMNHSSTLGFSPQLPVSVYGTSHCKIHLRSFSWKYDYQHYLFSKPPSTIKFSSQNGFTYPNQRLHSLTNYSVSSRLFHLSVTPSIYSRYRNINRFAIDFPFRVRLRSRLTHGRLTYPWKP